MAWVSRLPRDAVSATWAFGKNAHHNPDTVTAVVDVFRARASLVSPVLPATCALPPCVYHATMRYPQALPSASWTRLVRYTRVAWHRVVRHMHGALTNVCVLCSRAMHV